MAKKRVISKTKVIRFIVILLLLLVLLSMLFSFVWYKVNIKKVNNNDKVVPFLVNENDTYITIVDDLKEKDLIRSALAYKIYLKLNKTDKLVVGVYPLKQNMSVKDIIETFKKGPDDSLTNTKITFNEGINVRKIASKIEENTKYKKEDVYNLLKDTKFLDTLINKYWFITKEVKNKNIYYSLEGYLFPDTYIFKKDETLENMILIILNNMEQKLDKYKSAIQKSKHTVHEILTLASIAELEASTLKDRKNVIGVFYNRLNRGMGLESDVTTYYGLKKELTESITGHVYDQNAYNTRNTSLNGKLPVGPIGNPSIEAIEATINYEKNNYLYFVADTNKKVYFTKTYLEHQQIIKKLKDQGLWNA